MEIPRRASRGAVAGAEAALIAAQNLKNKEGKRRNAGSERARIGRTGGVDRRFPARPQPARHWTARRRTHSSGKGGFQRRHADLQGLVLLARDAGHIFHRFELVALDQIEIAQPALGLRF